MTYLTLLGSLAGATTEIDMEDPEQYAYGKEVAANAGCLGCHKFGENGNDGPGPNLTTIGARLPKQAIERTLNNPTAPMPSFQSMPEDQKTALVNFLGQLR
mgnify:CR=1 FL=1